MRRAIAATTVLSLLAAGTMYAQSQPLDPAPPMTPAPTQQQPAPAPAPAPMTPAPAPITPAPAPIIPTPAPPPTLEQAPEMTPVLADNILPTGYIELQASGQFLASDLMGRPVFNNEEEVLGVVNNLLITTDGQLIGVVLGVGGFLGIGQKNVAVSFAEIELRTDENGDTRLFFDRSREAFADAPVFRNLDQQEAEAPDPIPAPEPMAPAPAPLTPM